MNKSGAPKGGRVHWLALMLPRITIQKYDFDFDYDKHNYHLIFKSEYKNRYDEYTIIRTSEKCFRVIYYDRPTNFFEYKAYRKAVDVIDYILYRLPIKLKLENDFEQEKEIKRRKYKDYKLKRLGLLNS